MSYPLFFTLLPIVYSAPSIDSKKMGQQADVVPHVVVVGLKQPLLGTTLLRKTGNATLDALFDRYNVIRIEKLTTQQRPHLYKPNPRTRLDNIYFVHYAGSHSPEEVATALRKDPAVEFAEPKYIRTLYLTPNDSLLWQQYHLNLIQAMQAWDIVKAEEGDIIIAIVDGGTDIDHPDLKANLWRNGDEIPGNNIDDDANGFIDDVHGARMADRMGDPSRSFYLTGYGAHGTHTAGIAAAVTDNRYGVAGVSWNAKIMAVHSGSLTVESQIPYGFEGILYAVENGARVINCSWGGNTRSEYEARVVNYVNELGAVIVAAYGNTGVETEAQYPAAYEGVCGVAATDRFDSKASFSSFGYAVDVCAPGTNILSLYPQESYGILSGTSMATPVAAGIISLILTQNPLWSGLQAAEQLRITADPIDHLNTLYAGKLGRGRVNAHRALTESWPSIRITGIDIVDQDSLIKPGEVIKVSLHLKNYLAPAHNIALTLSENSDYITMTKAEAILSSLNTAEEKILREVFEFHVSHDAPQGHVVHFTLTIKAGKVRDEDHFSLVVWPSYANLTINHISMTVTSLGRIGFGDPSNSDNGIGFKYFNGPNLLFEGAVMAGTGPDRMVNAARGLIVGGQQPNDQDFTPAQDISLKISTPGSICDQESIAAFEDVNAQTPLNIYVLQQSYAFNREPFKDIILLRYTVRNQSASPLNNFYFGLFFDWDMDGGTFATNVADYDPQRRMGFVYDAGSGPDTYVGVQLLTAGGICYRAIYNDHTHPNNPSWGLHDGFTDAEKWQAISGGLTQTKAGPADISNVIAGGPYNLEPYGTVLLDFAFVAGNSLSEIQHHADAVKQMYDLLFTTPVAEPPPPVAPLNFILSQNYPNPFNDITSISYTLATPGAIELAVYNLKGEKIKTLVKGDMPAGRHQCWWDGKDENGISVSSGSYFYCLQTTAGYHQTHKMILLK